MIESLFQTLEHFIARQVLDKAIPSISYVLTDKDQILAAGHATNPRVSQQIDGRTLFRIGSLTKMFTAIGKAMAGLMDLVKTGRFNASQNVVFIHTGGIPEAYRACLPTRMCWSHDISRTSRIVGAFTEGCL